MGAQPKPEREPRARGRALRVSYALEGVKAEELKRGNVVCFTVTIYEGDGQNRKVAAVEKWSVTLLQVLQQHGEYLIMFYHDNQRWFGTYLPNAGRQGGGLLESPAVPE